MSQGSSLAASVMDLDEAVLDGSSDHLHHDMHTLDFKDGVADKPKLSPLKMDECIMESGAGHLFGTRSSSEGKMSEQDEQICRSCSFSSSDDEVKVCDICGDAGFEEMLAICSQCSEGAEHVYCMQTLLDAVPPNWVCEGCKMKEIADNTKERTLQLDVQEHLSGCLPANSFERQTSVDRTKYDDLCVSEEGKTVSERIGAVKDNASSSPSKKRPADNVEQSISKKHVGEAAHSLAGNPTLSRENLIKSSEPGKVKISVPSTFGSVPTGGPSPGGTRAAGKPLLAPSTPSPRPPALGQHGQNLKGKINSVGSETLGRGSSLMNNIAPNPRPVLSKSSSAKYGDEVLSFLLPSRPSILKRSSSGTARVPSFVATPKSSKPSNLSSSMAEGTINVKGHCSNTSSVQSEITKVVKFKSLGNADVTRSISVASRPLPVVCANLPTPSASSAPMTSFRNTHSALRVSEGDRRKNASPIEMQAPGWSEQNVAPSMGIPKCYKCKEIGHTAQACTDLKTKKEVSEAIVGSRQSESKVHENLGSLGKGRAMVNQPFAQGVCVINRLNQLSQVDQAESKNEIQSKKEADSVRTSPNFEGPLKSSVKMEPLSCSMPQSKPSRLSGSIEEHRFRAQGTERWKPDLVAPSLQISSLKQMEAAPPMYLPPRGICSPPAGNAPPWPFRPVDPRFNLQGMGPWGQQKLPGIIPTWQNAPGMGMPLRPAWNANLSPAAQFPHHQCYPPELPAIPESLCLWRGCIKVSSSTSNVRCYSGMQAHPSNRADPKVHEATKALPSQLQVEELQRGLGNDSWPKSFQEHPPNNNSIGIFFFPVDMESHDKFYKPLLDRMITCDLALRVILDSAQLLIFPSHLLPDTEQRWNDRMYLWGVFRANKGKALQTAVIDPHSLVTAAWLPPGTPIHTEVDPKKELESPNGIGEVIDMDVDMEGGRDVSEFGKIVKKAGLSVSETLLTQTNSPLPPLPPGSPPAQPPPPATPLQSQQDAHLHISKTLLDCTKHQLFLAPSTSSIDTPLQSRYSLENQLASPRDSGSLHFQPDTHSGDTKLLDKVLERHLTPITEASSEQPDTLSGGTKLLDKVSEGHPTPLNVASSEAALATGKDVLENKLEELPQPPVIVSKVSNSHVRSRSSELRQSGDGTISRLERDLCRRQESRECLNNRERNVCYSKDWGRRDREGGEWREHREMEKDRGRTKDGDRRKNRDRRKDIDCKKVADTERREVDGNEKLKENRVHSNGEVQRHWGKERQRKINHKHGQTYSHSCIISNSGSSSCSLSDSPSCSPSRREAPGHTIISKGTHDTSKHYRWQFSPSSSGSVATENGRASSRSVRSSEFQSGNFWKCSDVRNQEKSCRVLELSERNGEGEILQKTAATCSSGVGYENTSEGGQCNPDFEMERTETASQDTSTCVSGQFLTCLPLFPTEESSAEIDRVEILGDCVVEQEAGRHNHRFPLIDPLPFVEQLERPWYRPFSTSKFDLEAGPSSSKFSSHGQSEDDSLDKGPQLTLGIPHYRKEGNSWIKIEDDLASCFDGNVDLSLSLV